MSAVVNQSTVTLRCDIGPTDVAMTRWTYYRQYASDGGSVLYDGHQLTDGYRERGRHEVRCDDVAPRISGDDAGHVRCLLVIHQVQIADRGKYDCVVTPSQRRHVIWLYVVGKIHFSFNAPLR